MKPLHDYVLAEPEAKETQTSSGILLTETAQNEPKIAVVMAVGDGVKSLSGGERIVYKAYSTTEIELAEKKMFLVKEEDVLAVMEED